MTVSSTTVKNSYSGNGSNDTFVYGFKIFADTDLEVIIRSALGVETVKTLTTHYTVTNAGSASGGNVVFTSGNIPTATETVVVRREVPQTQAIDYIANDPFPAESHEEGLDRATMTIQQLQEEVNRAIKLSATNTMTSTEFTVGATDRANKVLSFDASGELSVAQELGTFKGSSATTTTAAYVVRDIVKGTTAAQLNNIYICIKASPVGTALTNTTYWVLIVDAVSAATSATAAAASATTAGNSATASANSATASASSATTSGNSATASANSATASANSATAAAASADAFDDIYLGTKSSDPSTDNDGDALAAGMLYFNSTNDIIRVYSGSAWQDAAISSTGVVTLAGTQTLTNKTLTSPKINENVAVTSTATELNLLDGKAATNLALLGKTEGTNFTDSLLVGHATTGTLNAAQYNTGVGIGALDALTSGDKNTGIGQGALSGVNSGSTNTAIGRNALQNVTTGGANTAIGNAALTTLAGSGSSCTAIGESALAQSTGNHNLGIGRTAGYNITSGAGNVIIGKVNAPSATSDRQLVIAGNDGSTTTTWISGDSSGNLVTPGTITANGVVLAGGSGLAWQSSIVTASTLSAAVNKGYWINTTSNACTITLPGSASVGDQLIFTDYLRTWGTNAVTINQNSLKFQGYTSPNPVYNTNGQSVDLIYSGATQGWIPNSDDDVTLETPQAYNIQYLIVGGGGGGGDGHAAGGGAGGLLASTLSVGAGNTLTAAIGGGGAKGSNNNNGSVGANTTLTSPAITNLTANGGGFGAKEGGDGGDGGSGGGGSGDGAGTGQPGGSGTAPQGNDGGTGAAGGGGGGGASAVGQNASGNDGGDGGAGTASTITGSSVTYAGGGGGCAQSPSTAVGSGGAGGGGNGGHSTSPNAQPGTDALGGGGGGSRPSDANGGDGGDGVVILRMATTDYSGTTSGSPTISTSGSDTIIKFTGNGTYTT